MPIVELKRLIHSKWIHISFELGLLIKAIDSLIEIIGGFLLLYLNPYRMGHLVFWLTQPELSEDPDDLIANSLIRFSHSFSISTQDFMVFYLLSHGLVKIILVLLLWRRKLWAYPLTIVSLVLFIAYQVYRFCIHPSAFLVILTAFDAVMIVLTYFEYQRIKSRLQANAGPQTAGVSQAEEKE